MIAYSDLNADFIIRRFPEYRDQAEAEMRALGEFLPHVIFGNVFHQRTVSLLRQDDFAENEMLRRIFDFYEEISSEGDDETRNLVQVTLLECLWDEKTTYQRASELIGEHTKELWSDIGSYLRTP